MSEEKEKKVELFKLYKPCGKAMKVNEDSLAYAKSIGWTEDKPKAEK